MQWKRGLMACLNARWICFDRFAEGICVFQLQQAAENLDNPEYKRRSWYSNPGASSFAVGMKVLVVEG
jgi:hypothetical protein